MIDNLNPIDNSSNENKLSWRLKFKTKLASKYNSKFTGLFIAQLLAKFFGVIREILVASIFGSSIGYINFVKLVSFVDVFNLVVGSNGLQANLLPYLISESKKGEIDYSIIKAKSLKIGIIIGIITSIFLCLVTLFILKYNSLVYYSISLLTGVSVGMLFYFNVGNNIILQRSDYKSYSKGIFIPGIVLAAAIYPLSVLFSVFGLAINRLLSIIIQYFFTWKKIPINMNGIKVKLKLSNFSLPVFFTNNSFVFIFFLIKMLFVIKGFNEIVYLTYAFVLAGVYDSLIVKNISTVLLEESSRSSIDKSRKYKLIFFSILSGLLFIVVSYFLGNIGIGFLYKRGNFNELDVYNTSIYLTCLAVYVFFNGIFNTFSQFIFSDNSKLSVRFSYFFVIGSAMIIPIILTADMFMNLSPIETCMYYITLVYGFGFFLIFNFKKRKTVSFS